MGHESSSQNSASGTKEAVSQTQMRRGVCAKRCVPGALGAGLPAPGCPCGCAGVARVTHGRGAREPELRHETRVELLKTQLCNQKNIFIISPTVSLSVTDICTCMNTYRTVLYITICMLYVCYIHMYI